MTKKTVTMLVVVLVVVVGGLIWWGIRDGKTSGGTTTIDEATVSKDTVYYYGAECPHCKDVQTFIDGNHITDKVTFTKKEVWHDQGNAKEMQYRATKCGLNSDQIGVPFVATDDGKCYVGTLSVIDFFKGKAGMGMGSAPDAPSASTNTN